MSSNHKTASNIIKGMAMGIALGSVVTMAITNKKDLSKKIKKVAENTTEGVSSMFKMQ
ncbi:MAG: hypothetical protein ACI3XS_03360 [Eubacteriales bacterium]